MLNQEDSRRLAELERQLRREDPEFCERIAGGRRGRIPVSVVLAATVIWIAALVLAVTGWWIAATIAALCATVLVGTLALRLGRGRRRSAGDGPPEPAR